MKFGVELEGAITWPLFRLELVNYCNPSNLHYKLSLIVVVYNKFLCAIISYKHNNFKKSTNVRRY